MVTPMCLHAYLVTREGARRMLEALSTCPGLCPADWAPAAMADTSAIFTIAPALFTQSTALRLQKDSGAVYSKADEARAKKLKLILSTALVVGELVGGDAGFLGIWRRSLLYVAAVMAAYMYRV